MSSKTALVLLADGAEEMEAVITIDVLRRAEINVIVASLNNSEIVECSRGVNIKADKDLSTVKDQLFDIVILPGGLKCAESLAASAEVKSILERHEKAGHYIAAICAAPTALMIHKIGVGKKVTSYPSMEKKMIGYTYSQERVVRDGHLITSRGPGTAFEFALEIVKCLASEGTAAELKEGMLVL